MQRSFALLAALLLAASLYAGPPVGLSPDDYVAGTLDGLHGSLLRGDVEPLDEFLDAVDDGAFQDLTLPRRVAGRLRTMLVVDDDVDLTTLLGEHRMRRLAAVADGATAKASRLFGCSPREFVFPRDNGKHRYFSEWWYFNGHMYASDGRPYGYELCFFRVLPAILFCHVAVTDERGNRFHYERRMIKPWDSSISRTGLDVSMGPWWVKQTGPGAFRLHGEVDDLTFDLHLTRSGEPFVINGNGLIDMPEGANSYYYSFTHLPHQGTLTRGGVAEPVTGQSWFDHQWGNFVSFRWGWDWFSFQMDDGSAYNLFSFRTPQDGIWKQFVNVRRADGSTVRSGDMGIERLAWWKSPATGLNYVTTWRLTLPGTGETVVVDAVIPQQEVASRSLMDVPPTYWEGRCTVEHVAGPNKGLRGLCYAEHFPYRSLVPPADVQWEH